MKVLIPLATVIALTLSPLATPADQQESPGARWGITTKKNLEEVQKTAPEGTEAAREITTQATDAHPSTDSVATSANDQADTTIAPQSDAPAKAGITTKAEPPAKTDTAATKKSFTPQVIHWSGEQQKQRCEAYLNDLRSLFLKTRHYSIQGASCDTAVSAAAFLKSMKTCQQNCPQGLLGYSGYTDRIIRNIRYLEKLGNDRCSGSLTPPAPISKTQ